MKRTLGIFLVASLALTTLTACGSQAGIELTDEQNEMVAEYMAGVLLKHDLRYEDALIYNTGDDSRKTDAAQTDKETDTKGKNTDPAQKDSGQKQDTKKKEPIASVDTGYAAIKDIYGTLGFQVSYTDYEFCSRYPKKSNDSYFPVEAGKGEKLLVLSFKVKNTDTKTKKADFMEAGISFRIDDGQGMISKPELTAVVNNDLQYLKMNIAGGKSVNAVLIFKVPESIQLDNYALYAVRNNVTAKAALSGAKS